jgi:hypothetical protein
LQHARLGTSAVPAVSPLLEDVSHPSGKWPTNKWFCLEWEFNDKPDSMKIWIDGEKVFETDKGYKADTTEDFVKGFSEFAFGFRSWGTVPNGFDVYYDDIAFGTSRIGPVK